MMNDPFFDNGNMMRGGMMSMNRDPFFDDMGGFGMMNMNMGGFGGINQGGVG